MTPLWAAFGGFLAELRIVSAAVCATGVMASSLACYNGGAGGAGMAAQLSTTTMGAGEREAGASETMTGSTSSEEELYCSLSLITVSEGA